MKEYNGKTYKHQQYRVFIWFKYPAAATSTGYTVMLACYIASDSI
jgi:hypothetical protein